LVQIAPAICCGFFTGLQRERGSSKSRRQDYGRDDHFQRRNRVGIGRQERTGDGCQFLEYAKSGHYDGTIFHRVIPGFVIQGGGLESGMGEKATRTPIKNEADNGLKNLTGTICMARTNEPHSATSQFFINLKDNSFLDHTEKTASGWGYAVFGRVTSGIDVVEAIAAVQTGTVGYHSDVPLEEIVLEKAVVND
jgi:peptidyl-prolyl cis-trans isomerase B (cyclophilin B)